MQTLCNLLHIHSALCNRNTFGATPEFRYAELAALIDPGKPPKSDRNLILEDAVRVINHARAENNQLRQLNKFLEDKVQEHEQTRSQALYRHSMQLQGGLQSSGHGRGPGSGPLPAHAGAGTSAGAHGALHTRPAEQPAAVHCSVLCSRSCSCKRCGPRLVPCIEQLTKRVPVAGGVSVVPTHMTSNLAHSCHACVQPRTFC